MDQNANRKTLQQIARKAMISRGLVPDFPAEVLAELKKIDIIEISTSTIFQGGQELQK